MLKTFAWMVDILVESRKVAEFFSILILYVILEQHGPPIDWSFNRWILEPRGDDEDPDVFVKSTPCGYDEFEVQQFKRRGKMVTWTEENHTSDLGQGVTPWQNGRVSVTRVSS